MSIFSEANLKQHEQWLHMLRVEEMRASNPADTQRILSKIEEGVFRTYVSPTNQTSQLFALTMLTSWLTEN